MNRSEPTSPAAGRSVRLEWSGTDGMRALTVVGTLGLVAAVSLGIFGLPSVDLHGPLHRLGIMDPLCGGTRAARLTAQGRLLDAWRYNPLGIFATLGAALAGARLAVGLLTRRWLNVRVAWTPKRTRLVIAALLLATIALQFRQQAHADLLLRPS